MRIFCTKCLEWEGSFSLTRTHTRAPSKQRCCFFAVTSVTPTILKRRKTLPPNTNIISKQRVVLPKTSGRLTKNIRSFYQKHQVILPKTTGRFTKNNRSFYQKRRLVFHQTSATNDTQVAHQRKTQNCFHIKAKKILLQNSSKGCKNLDFPHFWRNATVITQKDVIEVTYHTIAQ